MQLEVWRAFMHKKSLPLGRLCCSSSHSLSHDETPPNQGKVKKNAKKNTLLIIVAAYLLLKTVFDTD
ncbi:hypothetical protein ACXV6R_003919 [Yersinia enterocolitica]|nr:hypothetical protein [Yersinia enterocolitica]